MLSLQDLTTGSDYINASHVDVSLLKVNSYLYCLISSSIISSSIFSSYVVQKIYSIIILSMVVISYYAMTTK